MLSLSAIALKLSCLLRIELYAVRNSTIQGLAIITFFLSFSFPTAVSWELLCIITLKPPPNSISFNLSPSFTVLFLFQSVLGRGSGCSQKCLFGCQPGLIPTPDRSPMCLLGGDHLSHCLFLDALWWLSNNPCMSSCDPHSSGTHPDVEMLSPSQWEDWGSQPSPTKMPALSYRCIYSSFCAHWGFNPSPWAPQTRSCTQLAATCLGMAPNTAGAKKCSSVSKRGSAELVFICY